MRKHFSSCGEIISVDVRRDYETGLLEKRSFIRFGREGLAEKVMELNLSQVDGWTVIVDPEPSDMAPILVSVARAGFYEKVPV